MCVCSVTHSSEFTECNVEVNVTATNAVGSRRTWYIKWFLPFVDYAHSLTLCDHSLGFLIWRASIDSEGSTYRKYLCGSVKLYNEAGMREVRKMTLFLLSSLKPHKNNFKHKCRKSWYYTDSYLFAHVELCFVGQILSLIFVKWFVIFWNNNRYYIFQ